ncbi:MAG: fatty acyl-AMP ligase [Alphaproteobacteria bacterium]|nr:fatty acyl-AMP ligase [Alphaproteobacteria bacterium]
MRTASRPSPTSWPCCGSALPDYHPITARTLGEALVDAAARRPERGLRFLDRRERVSFLRWDELLERARATAGRLAALGVRPGERVALIYPTSPEFFDAFFGVTLAGAVPAPLYPPVRLGRMEEYHARTARMVQVSGARLVLTDSRVRRVLGQTMALAQPPLGCLTLDALPAGAPLTWANAPEELALVQFSSGTTVDPKPVALTHAAVVAQARIILEHVRAHPTYTDEGCCWLPLYHDMGLIGCVFVALLHSGTLTLIGPEVFITKPAVWLRALSNYGACVSPAPNFAYALCVDRIRDEELEGVDLSRWTMALNGAEPVAPEVLRAFQERFAKWGLPAEALNPVYGLSEAALAVSFSDLTQPFFSARFEREALARGHARPDPEGVEMVSVGSAVNEFELRVVDASAKPLPEGQVGQVQAKGPSLMREYLGDPEATARALQDGWLNTGDLGFFHEGQLFITGRAKDVLILRGRNHAPHPVEQSVDVVPGVRVGCAAAASHRPEGAPTEQLVLMVEHHTEASREQLEALPEACVRVAREATGLNVDELVLLPPGTLPRTSSGKIRRREALRAHLAGELVAPDKVNALKVVGLMARSALAFARQRPRSEPE